MVSNFLFFKFPSKRQPHEPEERRTNAKNRPERARHRRRAAAGVEQ